MKARQRSADIVAVPFWGPEPIGASAQDALDGLLGAQLAGYGCVVGWGLAGSVETTSQDVFSNPQVFTGGTGVPPVVYPETGLPSTVMPALLAPLGLGFG